MGITKKITFGFFTLALLLLFAGMVSMIELQRMRGQAERIISQNNDISLYAKILQTTLEDQNSAVVAMVLENGDEPGEKFGNAIAEFDRAVYSLEQMGNAGIDLTEVKEMSEKYRNAITYMLEGHTMDGWDTERGRSQSEWLINTYLSAYYEFDSAIKNFISSPHTSVSDETDQLVKSATRIFTPTIVTLFVAIIIVVIFSGFINIHYVKPIVMINAGLKGFINHRIPFNVQIENSGDEIGSLHSLISELIDRLKKQQK